MSETKQVNGGRRGPRTRRGRLAALAAVAALGLAAFGISAAPAGAQWAWGCTYTYPNACFGPWGGNNYLITGDPDHSLWITATNNGYPPPKYDGRERYVCGSVWSGGAGTSIPWSCAWKQDIYTFPAINGEALIASELAYRQIALYQMIDYTENGP